MAKEQEPEMTSFLVYVDDGQAIEVEFELNEIDRVRGELERAMQTGAAWFVGDYIAKFNGHEVQNINGRRIVAYN